MGFEPAFFEPWLYSDSKDKLIDAPEGDSILDWLPAPPIELDDAFKWLEERPKQVDGPSDGEFAEKLPALYAKAEELRLTLPDSFATFFKRSELLLRLRSSSGSYFAFGDALEPVANTPSLHFFPFLFDSQHSSFWYLVLNHHGGHCVATWGNLRGAGPKDAAAREQSDIPPDYYAPSFREAIYRYHMENEIFFLRDMEGKPLTQEMLDFLNG